VVAQERVYQLAKELNVDSRAVMNVLARWHEFVRSASSVVNPAAARRLREHFAGNARRSTPPSQPRRRPQQFVPGQGSPSSANPAPIDHRAQERAEAAAMFGIPIEQVRLQGERSRQADSVRMAWIREFFTPDEQAAWIKAGLDTNDLTVAIQCRTVGLEPRDLAQVVDGKTLGRRLREGETPGALIARLHQLEESA
jgi:hypothetical protein